MAIDRKSIERETTMKRLFNRIFRRKHSYFVVAVVTYKSTELHVSNVYDFPERVAEHTYNEFRKIVEDSCKRVHDDPRWAFAIKSITKI